jgi:signal peptidase I
LSLKAFFFRDVAQELLRQGDAVLAPTQGGSMEPLIPAGALIEVEPRGIEALRRGDVIVYRSGEALVAHRLVGKTGAGADLRFITKGDAASWRLREEVAPGQVLGRVCAVSWPRGLRLRIDSGWGRMLSLALAVSWPVSQGIFLLLVKAKSALDRLGQAGPGSRVK